MTRTRKVILGVAAALVIVGLAVLSIGVWWASSLYQSEQADQARADAAFAEIRARFPGIDPAFQIRERRLAIARPAVTVVANHPSGGSHAGLAAARADALARHAAVVDVQNRHGTAPS